MVEDKQLRSAIGRILLAISHYGNQSKLCKVPRFAVLLYFLIVVHIQAAPQNTNAIHILFVGNSYIYADDIPWITKQLAASAHEPKTLDVEMIASAGATLQSHWETGEVTRRLHEGKWEYVVLQEQSTRPIDQPGSTQKYARLLDSEIKKAGAKSILFVTWPRREQPETFNVLTNIYMNLGKELNATIAPVGTAWLEILKDKPSLPIYHQDGSHPNPIGSYLASCVLYSVIFQKNPIGLPRTLYTARSDGSHTIAGNLNEQDAVLIQRVAWQAVHEVLHPK